MSEFFTHLEADQSYTTSYDLHEVLVLGLKLINVEGSDEILELPEGFGVELEFEMVAFCTI